MIIIFSNKDDTSTNEVINWLDFYSVKYIRFNSSDFLNSKIKINPTNRSFLFNIKGNEIKSSEIKAAWFRRFNILPYIKEGLNIDIEQKNQITKALFQDIDATVEYLFNCIPNKKWLNNPKNININKLLQLEFAHKIGFKIPKTITTNDKDVIKEELLQNKFITKSIDSQLSLDIENNALLAYTSSINNDDLTEIPQIIPSLIQSEIDKDIEIRSFLLGEELYSMAIFSQEDNQTSVDFRKYNLTIPNRTIPYKLPLDIEEKILSFAKYFNLNSGSFDIIKDKKGEYVFLEVNPVGQFGMVSQPCNYNLEQKIAKYLIKISERK